MASDNNTTFEISPQTGQVVWAEYVLSMKLTHDEFVRRYSQLSPARTEHLFGIKIRSYQLPTLMADDLSHSLMVFFLNQYISSISIYKTSEHESNMTIYSQRNLLWLTKARELLRELLGKPHRTCKAHLLAEASELSEDYLQRLEDWHYSFDWGKVRLIHDSEFWADSILVEYDHFQQIVDWDELLEEWSRQIEVIRSNSDTIPPGLMDVPSTIDLIRPHFVYQTVRPKINSQTGGLLFYNSKRYGGWFISLDINANRSKGMYKIERSDSIRRDYVNGETVVDTLRMFIESEHLE